MGLSMWGLGPDGLAHSATTPTNAPAPEPAAPPDVGATPAAMTKPQPASSALTGAALQVALSRSNFSPGLIDGKPGRKAKLALEQFRRARGIPEPTDVKADPKVNVIVGDEATLAALAESERKDKASATASKSGRSWVKAYRITEADIGLVTGPIPTDWNERAQLAKSGYETMQELLAERGWCSQDVLAQLNPGVAFDALEPGDEVSVPDAEGRPLSKLSRLEVDLAEKLILGFDAEGTQVLLMHCSIAKAQEKRPVGELKVKVVATDPEYTFNPADWPEVSNVTSKLKIAPGPRNPVGSAWIGLDKPGYGLHGTVRPQDIGKTGSHGCFRLANWDAVRLAKAVKIGMVVDVKP